ncbi:MAG: hydroxymethylbilane synthase [Fuerstiella sp.]
MKPCQSSHQVTTNSVVRIATRASKLALWQAEYIQSLIEKTSPETQVEIVHVHTEGDVNLTDPLRQFGGTGVFTKEVQVSVLKSATDIAVHSLKDLPTVPTDGLVLATVPERAARADVIVCPEGKKLESIDDLPNAARIGTGSPRRQAQLLHVRPDLNMLEIRGNLQTRLKKLDDGEYDAIVLAQAGLTRLEMDDRISFVFPVDLMTPAVGQGAIGVECRADDEATQQILNKLTDKDAWSAITAERALIRELEAGCHAPLGAWTSLTDGKLKLSAVLLSEDGTTRLTAEDQLPAEDAKALGISVAKKLQAIGGDDLLHSN